MYAYNVSMYVCMYDVCMYVCMYARMYLCNVCMYVYLYVRCMYVCLFVLYVCMYVCVCAYMHLCMYHLTVKLSSIVVCILLMHTHMYKCAWKNDMNVCIVKCTFIVASSVRVPIIVGGGV